MYRSGRTKKIWWTVAGLLLGTAVVTGLAWWETVRRTPSRVGTDKSVTNISGTGTSITTPDVRFTEVARNRGIEMRHGPGPRTRHLPEDTGSGLAWGDYDGDGDFDLYVVNFTGPTNSRSVASNGTNRLYRNDDGTFTDVTREAGVGDADGFGMGATFADYDADGEPDLYVTNFGPNRLYRNEGNGTFTEISVEAGVAGSSWSTGATWGDVDRDGNLDLYVCNYVDYDVRRRNNAGAGRGQGTGTSRETYTVPYTLNPNSFDPQSNRLYLNTGNGSFREVGTSGGVDNPNGRSMAASFCDLNGDGWADLYVNNDVSTNRFYRNTGPVRTGGIRVSFEEVAARTGTADSRGSMGLSIGEVGGLTGHIDGRPDLFITHWVAQDNALYQSTVSGGQLMYFDKARSVRIGEPSTSYVGWGSVFADLDLDGRIDLAVASGSTLETREGDPPYQLREEPLFLLWNDGEIFRNVAPRAGDAVSRRYNARGLAAADYDRDGDVDLAVSVNRGPPLLFRNDTATGHHSLAVRLSGDASVRFGASVEVRTKETRRFRWFGSDVSYLSMHAKERIFGLGKRNSASTIRVRWGNGGVSNLSQVPCGRIVVEYPEDGEEPSVTRLQSCFLRSGGRR